MVDKDLLIVFNSNALLQPRGGSGVGPLQRGDCVRVALNKIWEDPSGHCWYHFMRPDTIQDSRSKCEWSFDFPIIERVVANDKMIKRIKMIKYQTVFKVTIFNCFF